LFLERRGETLTVVKMRDYLREIDLDFNQKVRAARRGSSREARALTVARRAQVSFIEYVLWKYQKTLPQLFTPPPGGVANAALLRALDEAISQHIAAKEAVRVPHPSHRLASHRSAQADRASDSNACARPRCNGCTRRHRDLARSPACRPPTSATSWPARSSPRCAISLSSCAALSLTRADVAAVEIRGAPSAEGQEGRAEGARRGAQDRPLRGGAEAPRRGGSSQGRGRAASQGRVALAPQGPRCPVAVSRHRVHVRHQASATSSGLCPTSQPRVAAHTGTDIRHEIFI